jgi:Arc/MetJ-type ribon-helix-helix transcriptional regulator
MEVMPKIPISVTVEKKYVEWVDKQTESLRFRNRSHAVEYALAKLIEFDKKGRI